MEGEGEWINEGFVNDVFFPLILISASIYRTLRINVWFSGFEGFVFSLLRSVILF